MAQEDKIYRKCPKCESTYGLILAKKLNKGESQVLCFNGNCDFKMNILEWNKKYTRSQLKDPGRMKNIK